MPNSCCIRLLPIYQECPFYNRIPNKKMKQVQQTRWNSQIIHNSKVRWKEEPRELWLCSRHGSVKQPIRGSNRPTQRTQWTPLMKARHYQNHTKLNFNLQPQLDSDPLSWSPSVILPPIELSKTARWSGRTNWTFTTLGSV